MPGRASPPSRCLVLCLLPFASSNARLTVLCALLCARSCFEPLARSRNAFVDAYLGEEDGLDSFADLEDFIVCRADTTYG